MDKCTVLIPTYNEIENIEPMVEAVLSQGSRFKVLVIDDNSPDGTGRVADRLAAADERVSVLHRPKKQGLGPAYISGFKKILSGDDSRYLITMDADFSHDPRYITSLLNLAEEGGEVAIGSRYCRSAVVESWSLHRRLMSRLAGFYVRSLLNLGVNDCTSGFICIDRKVLQGVDLDDFQTNGYGFLIELKYKLRRSGARLAESPIIFQDRKTGQTKMNAAIALEALLRIPRLAIKYRFGGGL